MNLLRAGRKIVIKRIAKVERNTYDNFRDYINEERLHGRPSPQEINEEISKTEEFINEVKGQYGEDVEDLLNILEELCTHKDNQANSQEKHIVSFTDTDARFGAKSDSKKFVGYKAHIAMDESGIVTSVNILHGNESESTDLPELLKKDESVGIKATAITADSLYDSAKNREFIHSLGLKAYIPPRRKERDEEGFIYDTKKDIVTCPYGNIAKSGRCRQEMGALYNFNPKICRACIDKCKWYKKDRCRLFVSDDLKLRAGDRDEFYNEALEKRKGIERKFGEAKKWHGLRRARYRGKWRVAIQVLMTFIVVNIKRMVKILKEGLNKVPYSSVICALPKQIYCSELALEIGQ